MSSEEQTQWVLERVEHPKFPYRLTVVKGTQILLALRVGDRWPGGSGNVFCLREKDRGWPPPGEEVERVPVVTLKRYGKRLSIVLDRPTHRRCDFLFLTKGYKHKEGEYEQIFWQTQKGLQERKPRSRFTIYGRQELHILVEAHERYPWRFPGAHLERGHLPAGDYALIQHEQIAAVFAALGYPTYIVYPLAVAKLLGVIAILTGKSSTLKYLAYAGFFYDFLLAGSAHIAVGDGEWPPALVALILVTVSFVYDRKREAAAHSSATTG